MCIPSSSEPLYALRTAACAMCTAICTATALIWHVLSSIMAKVRKITLPIFHSSGVPENGSVGYKPFSPRVRILYVNGVGTTVEQCRRTAYSISRIFNQSLVHYTFIPLRYDHVLRTIMGSYRLPACDLLLSNIRSRLHELDYERQALTAAEKKTSAISQPAIAEASKLIIFVHSGGGAMLEAVRDDLTSEERRQIDVYSFGSAHLFSADEGFDTVKNAVAAGDPVPQICRLVDRRIHPLGEPWNIGAPSILDISSHSILSDIYQMAIWHIKENYATPH